MLLEPIRGTGVIMRFTGVDFVAVNTDAQSLAASLAPKRIQIGSEGLGAGARPELGRQVSHP